MQKSLYDLIPFIYERNAINKTANFYPTIIDKAQGIYNDFANQSQVLQFVSEEGWEPLTVVQEINSKPETQLVQYNWQVYTKITTRPVFYFRKVIE